MTQSVREPVSGDPVTERHDILEEVSHLIGSLQRHPDPTVGEQVTALLDRIDFIHRSALTHLFNAIQGMGGETAINRLTADPAIRLLLMSYDLLAVDRRIMTEEALDAVRGHLHAHGVHVELLDVAGGEVFVQLHGVDESDLSPDAVRRDIEAALGDGPIGFQVLTIGKPPAHSAVQIVQLEGRRPLRRPVYRPTIRSDDLPSGETCGVEVDAELILLANVAGVVYAVANHCGESPLPLEFSTLDGATLTCSWHGCRYDVRTGERLDDTDGDRLRVYPVRVEEGNVQVAIGVESVSDQNASASASHAPRGA